MKLSQDLFTNGHWKPIKINDNICPTIIICFGNKAVLEKNDWNTFLRLKFKNASIISVSTAGEITNNEITDDSIVATAIELQSSTAQVAKINIAQFTDSLEAGKAIASLLPMLGLRFVMVFADGAIVNGGDLVNGLNEFFKNEIPVAGGLAGDGAAFNSTLVGLNDDVAIGNIVAIGFYGSHLKFEFGSNGGWSEFGPTRTITKSNKNVLYEIDNKNALDLYKEYLGDYADKLPGSALLFPIALTNDQSETVVRTILSVDQQEKTMTFAGNMPEGSQVRLMKTTLDKLVDAASSAADVSEITQETSGDKLSILISCVGRKLVFGNRVDEEFEAVREALGPETLITGFYSYGEISPLQGYMKCQLHNQTMTITTLAE